ncbi:phosphatase PAP2 family protein [Rheinheimera texasensis]|uniref:phosphatase PAP2 family protein n=1 Tax=Rheinheimera texasensis TaxID=306205 RepID=UPI0012FF3FB1|nr:phosphatase PAP2 family protein [Rheinheimera texasensis]
MSLTTVFPPAKQLLLRPLLVLVTLFGLCYGLGFDFALSTFWYQLQDQSWALQHHWLTEDVLHRGVRNLNQLLIAGLLLHFVLRLSLHQYRRARGLTERASRWTSIHQQAHGRLLLSLTLSLAGVAIIKHSLPMDCPWDLQAFGGTQSFTGLFSSWPANRAPNACFPAGHASIGFAWLGLYFFCLQLYPTLARPALMLSLTLGFGLGLVQQLRGAHFISHDIASAAWCWSMACLCAYWPALRQRLSPVSLPTSYSQVIQND